jgi:hypothetical protein
MLDKQTMKKRALAEAKNFSLVVGYLWVALSLLELHKWVILRQHNIGYELGYRVGFNLINALALGKVIVISTAAIGAD